MIVQFISILLLMLATGSELAKQEIDAIDESINELDRDSPFKVTRDQFLDVINEPEIGLFLM